MTPFFIIILGGLVMITGLCMIPASLIIMLLTVKPKCTELDNWLFCGIVAGITCLLLGIVISFLGGLMTL